MLKVKGEQGEGSKKDLACQVCEIKVNGKEI